MLNIKLIHAIKRMGSSVVPRQRLVNLDQLDMNF